MNNINVTVQLCAEDRARLDGILEALNHSAGIRDALTYLAEVLDQGAKDMIVARGMDAIANGIRKLDAKEPAGAVQPDPAVPAEEKATENTAPAEPPAEEPQVPSEDELRSLVQAMIAAGYRDAVKAIVQGYAPKVSDVPEDKRAECIEKLQALKEGKA